MYVHVPRIHIRVQCTMYMYVRSYHTHHLKFKASVMHAACPDSQYCNTPSLELFEHTFRTGWSLGLLGSMASSFIAIDMTEGTPTAAVGAAPGATLTIILALNVLLSPAI